MTSHPNESAVKESETGVTIKVRVQPKASRNQVDGYAGDSLRLRVTAPPQGGKANLAVVDLLAETLGVPKSRLRIVRGQGAREKLVQVSAMTLKDVEGTLNAALNASGDIPRKKPPENRRPITGNSTGNSRES